MRFALFCDGAYCIANAAIAADHVLVTIGKVEVVRVIVVVVVRRRTPIEAYVTIIVERCPATAARCRKEDAVAIRSCYPVDVNAVLCCPFPCTVT